MAERMRAAMLHAPGELRIEEVERPEPAEDQVLIRIHNCGVCPSDVRSYTGERGGQFPRTPGHEWAGEVAAVGPAVEGFAVGDRVVPDWRGGGGGGLLCPRGEVLDRRRHV